MKHLNLSGEVALVTGGAGAIGGALGRALEKAGATVVLSDLRGGLAAGAVSCRTPWRRAASSG